MNRDSLKEDIAIIGIGLNINDTHTLQDYWEIFENNIDCIRELPKARKEQIDAYSKLFRCEGQEASYFKGSYLDRIDEFDNDFFNILPKEAQVMDPVHRIMLEVIFSAFDDAGYTPEMLRASKTGIYLGYTPNHLKNNYLTDIIFRFKEYLKYALTGNMAAMIPSRVSHLLDLHGPTMVIDTACSSSLVAVHQACQAIFDGVCDKAVAGGIKMNLLPLIDEDMNIGIEAGDEKTRTLDDYASGATAGEGFACVLLKKLSEAERDHDNIYAVIKGSAINHDGNSTGLTAPNPASQKAVILDAIQVSGINPEDIQYVEMHGTGTILGDPIEFQGLSRAFEKYTQQKQYCALSSAKGNIGHLHECAGIASLIKAVGALKAKRIPGMRHFSLPNRKIDFCDSPFYVSLAPKDWISDKPRTCAVSAFGLSGTNCHLILQEYSALQLPCAKKILFPAGIFTISAKSEYSLKELAFRYRAVLVDEGADLFEIAANANLYRSYHPIRLAIVYQTRADLIGILDQIAATSHINWPSLAQVYYQKPGTSKKSLNSDELIKAVEYVNITLVGAFNDLEELLHNLKIIASTYAEGYPVDWKAIYRGMDVCKQSLPPYPFVKTRTWLPNDKLPVGVTAMGSQKNQDLNRHIPKTIPLFYERTFYPVEAECGKDLYHAGLVIQLDTPLRTDLLSQIGKVFTDHTVLTLQPGKAVAQGVECYFQQTYRNINFNNITHIIFTSPCSESTGLTLKDRVKINLFSIICLYKVLKEQDVSCKIAFLMDSCFQITKTETLYPENAAIFGLCKSLNREFKSIHSYCIDYDTNTKSEALVDGIISSGDRDILAFRDNIRYWEMISEKELPDNQTFTVEDGGVYLISGGLGGIAYEVAKALAKQSNNISLLLLGRSPLDGISSGVGGDSEEKRNRFRHLEQSAKSVTYYPCDVTDFDAVKKVVDLTVSKYGKINGVIHAAGVGGGISVDQLDEDRVMSMISPKILGTYYLDMATRTQQLDFFLMFSSIATIFSSSELADYTAGNMYMDAYSYYRSTLCSGKSITVNWATWLETGMSVKNNYTIDTLFKSITTDNAIHGLMKVMAGGSANLVIGQLNLDSKMALLLRKYPMSLSAFIKQTLDLLDHKDENSTMARSLPPSLDQYSSIEKEVIYICCNHLGIDELSLYDNFFELGADSIMLGIIFRDIDALYPDMLQVTDIFIYPTVGSLAECLTKKMFLEVAVTREMEADEDIPGTMNKESEEVDFDEDGIAIIGIGIDLPNADTLESYWEILVNGISTVREMPETRIADIRKHLKYKGMADEDICFRKCGYLDEINKFDYGYFNMSPKEASLIDPVNRLFLQCCAKAIDDSGYGMNGVKGSNTGIFLGYTSSVGNAYGRLIYDMDSDVFAESLAVNQPSMAASRIAYVYNLKGPSMVVDTACSSTHIAIHMACEQIRNGKCDMALAGGASITQTPYAKGFAVGFESDEYVTRTFSDSSTGSAIAEGVGAFLLKDLKLAKRDNDPIYAIIKGSAINQDGSSFGIAAPNYLAQAEVIKQAWSMAGIKAEDVSYIEAHGTGTQLGDPIEVNGITTAFRAQTESCQICGIGSVKTNIGHANESSGICGITKAILTLNHMEIPPSLNFHIPNLNIDFTNTPLFVVNKNMPLPVKNKRPYIGSSGFGMSGTNGHIILTESPKQSRNMILHKEQLVFTASARNSARLNALLQRYHHFLIDNPDTDIADFCYTTAVGREHFAHRVAFMILDINDLVAKLNILCANELLPKVNWLYAGHYAIVPTNKKDKFDYELTRNEFLLYNKQAEQCLMQRDSHSWSRNHVSELLTLYVKGADINWNAFFKEKYNRLHVPTYPFEKNYCWYPIPELSTFDPDTFENGFHYANRWIEQQSNEFKYPADDETVLVLYYGPQDDNGLTDALLDRCNKVIKVYNDLDHEFYRNGDTYFINGTIEGYTKLFDAIKQENIMKIVHKKGFGLQLAMDIDSVYKKLDNGFFDVVSMIKGMSKAHFDKNISLTIIAEQVNSITGTEDYLYPQNAPVLSLAKVIEQEYPNIVSKALDVDAISSPQSIVAELFSCHSIHQVGLRSGKRYIEELDELELEKQTDIRIKEDGVYLITGGTDGIGLALAEYISTQNPCHLVLLSRKGFIDESVWDNEDLNADQKKKVSVLQIIKKAGCTVDVFSCDISEANSIKTVLDVVRNKYGCITGIIHSAGISGAGYILRKEKESFLSVFAPKIKGTLNLEILTKEDPLDFMVFCSSAVSYFGEAGQSDYIGANSFLDAYTNYRNKKGHNTYTANWVSWKETGMAVRYGINVDTITKALTTREAVEAFHKLLCSKPARAMIGQFNLSSELVEVFQYSHNYISPRLREKVQQQISQMDSQDSPTVISNNSFAKIKNGKVTFIPKSEKALLVKSVTKNIKMEGDVQNEYSATENDVALIYSLILGHGTLNVYENFFEMGGDSVMLANMHDRLEKEFPNVLKVADLFEYVNIRSLAAYIDERLGARKKSDSVYNNKTLNMEINDTGTLTYHDMSIPQQSMYYENRINKNKLAFNNPFVIDMTGVDDGVIKALFQRVIDKHDMLRTCFILHDRKVMQCVCNDVSIEIDKVEIGSNEPLNFKKYLKEFDLSKVPLYHLTIIRHGRNKYLLFDVHHILLDGYSSSLLQEDLRNDMLHLGENLHFYSYNRFVAFEQEFYSSKEYDGFRSYWYNRLDGYSFQNPFKRSLDNKEATHGSLVFTFSSEVADLISEFAKQNKTTQYNILLASLFLAVSAITQKSDICIITTMLNRYKGEFNHILGLFTNMLPIRCEIDSKVSLEAFLQAVIENTKNDIKNQYYQYTHLIQDLRNKNPQFYCYLNFEDTSLKNFTVEKDVAINKGVAKNDMHFDIKRRNSLLDVELQYMANWYDEKYARRLLNTFILAVSHLVTVRHSTEVSEFIKLIEGCNNEKK